MYTSSISPTKLGMSRWKAAGIHLGISVALASLVVLLLYFLWYPSPYFDAMGGKFLLVVLVGVDVVLGPLITLIIFNTKKKSLKFDLAVIAFLQIAALGYGVYVMYQARPVFVVYSRGAFTVVPANDIEPERLEMVKRTEFRHLTQSGPMFVYNSPPKSSEDLVTLMTATEGLAPEFYLPYREKAILVAKEGKPLTELLKRRPNIRELVSGELKKVKKDEKDVVYFPILAKTMNMTALCDAVSGEILAVLPVDPL